jgi:hypothetical protein
LNGQQYETVTVHSIDGKTRQGRRLVEREWCGRCRKLLSVDLPNKELTGNRISPETDGYAEKANAELSFKKGSKNERNEL